jgi:hypothetical protein
MMVRVQKTVNGMRVYKIILIFFLLLATLNGAAQISPGELAMVHAHLEGISNCTKCHTLGDKVSNEKCLDCHSEIKVRLDASKGFHSSTKVKSKDCTVCHGDHYGRNFDIVHLVKEKFDHNDTGYKLEGSHVKPACTDCHKKENIADAQLKKIRESYLGLSRECAACHEDVHQKTLPADCRACHTYDAFKPASGFSHARAKFPLKARHAEVACEKCHPRSIRNGKSFQQFTGLKFQNCSGCHPDPHDNKFGQNCSQCHVEESFRNLKSTGNFDHSRTGFMLEGRHANVACKLCHKISITAPVKHEKCADCHKDYHHGQFVKNAQSPDCSECHGVNGFAQSSFTIDKHNQSGFKLEGAHLATPCLECHKKQKEWNFRNIGIKCVDCHQDIHLNLIDPKYYPSSRCENCHGAGSWKEVTFDHRQTSFILEGRHASVSCRQCHFKRKTEGANIQLFSGLSAKCESCHSDVHFGQFSEEKQVACLKCHGFENWKPVKFNHDETRFKLDGGHKNVACGKCHKPQTVGSTTFINYKFKEILCATCH